MKKSKKSIVILLVAIVMIFVLAACQSGGSNSGGGGTGSSGGGTTSAGNSGNSNEGSSSMLVADSSELYYMITFAFDSPYWVDVYGGFTSALGLYGAATEYTGTAAADISEQVTLMEQIIAKQPAGIAIAAANADGIVPAIKKATDAGIPVVNFDAKAASGTYGFIGTGNYEAGVAAAHEMAALLGGTGKIGVVTVIDTDSTRNRGQGFTDTITNEYPNMEVVQTVDGKYDQAISADVTSAMLQSNTDIVGLFASFAQGGVGCATAVNETGRSGKVTIISFDTDPGTLDLVKNGTIAGTMAQGTWIMGWQSGHQLFWLYHNLMEPKPNWKSNGISPLPNNVDTGITFVTADNADLYYPAE